MESSYTDPQSRIGLDVRGFLTPIRIDFSKEVDGHVIRLQYSDSRGGLRFSIDQISFKTLHKLEKARTSFGQHHNSRQFTIFGDDYHNTRAPIGGISGSVVPNPFLDDGEEGNNPSSTTYPNQFDPSSLPVCQEKYVPPLNNPFL